MKLLLTAYCCAPGSGSEQAFGWWWVTSCAADHEVVVLTPACQREAIEAALPDGGSGERLTFHYVRGPGRISPSGNAYRFERLHQYLWELRAIRPARRAGRSFEPDVAQKVTTGTWRAPSCLAFIGTPYILGPLAGSEGPPPTLARSFGLVWWTKEHLRAALIRIARWDPFVTRSLAGAAVILAAGPQTIVDLRRRFPEKTHSYTRAFPHPGITALPRRGAEQDRVGPVQLCWAGRLTERKGLGMLLDAMRDPRLEHYTLDVFGEGPKRAEYVHRVERSGLSERVNFRGHTPQATTWAHLRACDAFVFTSLHDLMGQALSEAMQVGAACVVLDWSGPAMLLGEHGGLKIAVSSYEGTVDALASGLARLSTERGLIEKLQQAALDRVSELIDICASTDARNGVFEAVRDGRMLERPRVC